MMLQNGRFAWFSGTQNCGVKVLDIHSLGLMCWMHCLPMLFQVVLQAEA